MPVTLNPHPWRPKSKGCLDTHASINQRLVPLESCLQRFQANTNVL